MRGDRPVIVIPGDDPPQIAGSPHLERLQPFGEVVLYDTHPSTDAEKVRRARHATAIINSRSHVSWPAAVLDQLPQLRMMTVGGIGTDAIDLNAARARGIVVSNIPGRTAQIVAEHALALALALARRTAYLTAEMKAGRWTQMLGVSLIGRRLGVVGTGNIGCEMIRLARVLGMHVVAWSFHPNSQKARDFGFQYVELDELLRTCDVVSVHVKLTEDSRHLIGARELTIIKRGCLLVNTARGAVIDTDALVAALESGCLGGAALDVFDVEPLPADHPLLRCPHVVLTPHCADQTPEGIDILNAGCVDNVIAFFEGRPQNVVT
jgi:D-3-phosphoglycerate dehydrogenase